MRTLLRIDSSPRQQSKTRALTEKFEQGWLAQNTDGVVIHRDLASEALPFLTEEWINANFTPAERRTAEQQALLAQSDGLVAEWVQADDIVIGSPMWNFGAPASMKAYIDLLARAGKTFRYTEKGPVGMLSGKRVVVITARGGQYSQGSPLAHLDFQEPYLRQVFGFLGVTDVTFVHAENQSRGGDLATAGEALAQRAIEEWMGAGEMTVA